VRKRTKLAAKLAIVLFLSGQVVFTTGCIMQLLSGVVGLFGSMLGGCGGGGCGGGLGGCGGGCGGGVMSGGSPGG
jgi:hypothetical protein